MEFLIEHWPAAAFIVGMLVLLVLARVLLREPPPPYEKRDGLVTETELKFYHVLAETAEDYTIFAMVRIADLLRVREQTEKRQSWQNKINQKHIDFVLCDPESLEPQLAIELDDSSHQRADRQRRDEFVNEAFSAAALPLLRVPVQAEYDPEDLRQEIDSAIEKIAA